MFGFKVYNVLFVLIILTIRATCNGNGIAIAKSRNSGMSRFIKTAASFSKKSAGAKVISKLVTENGGHGDEFTRKISNGPIYRKYYQESKIALASVIGSILVGIPLGISSAEIQNNQELYSDDDDDEKDDRNDDRNDDENYENYENDLDDHKMNGFNKF